MWDEEEPALGQVVEEDRGHLAFALVHGEPLVAAAAWALGDAGVRLLDLTTPWEVVVEAGVPLVLHDCLCPMTPPEFLETCLARARAEDVVVVGVRPVTDTIKQVQEGYVGATVDRDTLVTVTSPIVLPASLLPRLSRPPSLDFPALVADLEARDDVRVARVEGPPSGRRVVSAEDVEVLEALTRPAAAGSPGPGPRGR